MIKEIEIEISGQRVLSAGMEDCDLEELWAAAKHITAEIRRREAEARNGRGWLDVSPTGGKGVNDA